MRMGMFALGNRAMWIPERSAFTVSGRTAVRKRPGPVWGAVGGAFAKSV